MPTGSEKPGRALLPTGPRSGKSPDADRLRETGKSPAANKAHGVGGVLMATGSEKPGSVPMSSSVIVNDK